MQVRANTSLTVSFFDEISGMNSGDDSASLPAVAGTDCAGGARELLRSSNTAIVTQENLLNFGLDWLALFIGYGNRETSELHSFIEEVFGQYDEEGIFEEAQNIIWPSTSHSLSVRFKKAQGDLMGYFSLNGESIIGIRKITLTSTYPQSVKGKYEYLITFYGDFFALSRLGSLSVSSFYSLVLQSPASSIVSQIHVFCDVENVSVQDFYNTLVVSSPHHAKDQSILRRNQVTGIPQTMYYGQKSDPLWFLRIYDKLAEINKDHKQRLYRQYWGKKMVTRFETVFKRTTCRAYEITPQNCFDESLLLSLLGKHLIGKYVQWNFMPSLESALKERGLQIRELVPLKFSYDKLTEEKRYQRLIGQLYKFSTDYGLIPPPFLRYLADQYEAIFPSK